MKTMMNLHSHTKHLCGFPNFRFSFRVLSLFISLLFLTSCLSKKGSDQVTSGSLGLKLAIMAGNNQSGDPNRLYNESLQVMVQDAVGDPIEDITVEFFEISSKGAYVTNSTTSTNANGYAVTDVRAPASHNSSIQIGARIRGSEPYVTFTLETSDAPEGGRFVIESTGSGTETAGEAFGFTVRLESDGGGLLDYNGVIETQWLFDSAPSWGEVDPTVLPATYDCNFINGVCNVPASIVLTDAENLTYVYMGDGVEGFQDVFAQPITVLKNVPAQVVVVAGPTGGPENGGTVVNDEALNADNPAMPLYVAITDAVGNYLSDATTVAWTGSRTEISNYLVDNGDGTATFTPTRNIPFPATGQIFVNVGGYPQGSTGNIAIDPGVPTQVNMIPDDGNFTRTAGELMKFRLVVRDAQGNVVGQDSTSQGYTGAVNVKLTFSDYLTGPEASGGVVPEVFLNEAEQNGILEGDEVRSRQETEYTFTTQFALGVASVAEISRGIVFFDGTSVSPKIEVELTSGGALTDVTTTTTFNVTVGPENHIALRDAPGEAGESICKGYFPPMGNNASLMVDLYTFVETGMRSYQSGGSCGMMARAGDAPLTYHYALEDIAGNFLGNTTASLSLSYNSADSNFQGQFSPIGSSPTTTLTPITTAGGQDGFIHITGMVNGSSLMNRIYASIQPAAFDSWRIGYRNIVNNRPQYAQIDKYPRAGENSIIDVYAQDRFGNRLNNYFSRDFIIHVTGTLTNSPRGFPPVQIPPGGPQTITFLNGVGAVNFTPMNINDTVTVQFEDANTGDMSNTYTFSPRANDPNYIELRTAIGLAAGTNLTNAAMPVTTDDAITVYANLYDLYGNFKQCANVDWTDPTLTFFNPNDSANYTTIGCSTLFEPQKPTSSASRLGATYDWTDVDGNDFTITAQTGDISIDTGSLSYMLITPMATTLEAGQSTTVNVTLKDSKNNTLSDTGSKNVTINAVNNAETRLGFDELLTATTSLMFTAGEANFDATFYNSAVSPSLNISTTDAPIVSGQTADFTINAAPLDHLYLGAGGGLEEIDVGDTNTYRIVAEDVWGNRMVSGVGSNMDVTFELSNPALTNQDIQSTTLSSATSVAGANDTTVTGNLIAGQAFVTIRSTSAGELRTNGTSTTPINEVNNTEDYLDVLPLTTIDDIAFVPGRAPLPTHVASPTTPIFPFKVVIQDIFDNTITTNNTDTITLSLDTGTGTLGGTLTKTVVNGVADFDDIIYTTAEPIVLRLTLNSNPSKTITAAVTVDVGGISQTLVEMPDQTYVPGTDSAANAMTGVPFNGSGGSAAAGSTHTVRVRAVDEAFNTVQSFGGAVTLTLTDPNAVIASNPVNAVNGVATFSVTFRRQGSHTATASTVYNDNPSSSYVIDPGSSSQLLVLLPGQVLDQGAPDLNEAIDNPATTTQTAGTGFTARVVAVDNYYNQVMDNDGQTVSITTSDPNDSHPASNTLSGGERAFTVTNIRSGPNQTITPAGASLTPRNSELYTVAAGPATKTIVRMLGQGFSPGQTSYANAITGTASQQNAGVAFNVTVYAVDDYFNIDSTYNGAVSLATPNDPTDTEPVVPATFTFGQATFSVAPVSAIDDQRVSVTSGLNDAAHLPAQYDVKPGSKTYLLTLFDNQTLNQGQTSLAAAVTPSTVPNKTAGSAFNVTVYGTDVHYNIIDTDSSTSISINTSAPNDNHPSNQSLSSGTRTFSITNYKAGTGYTITASGTGYGGVPSSTYDLARGAGTHLIALLPGETLDEGHDTYAEAASGNPYKQTVGYTYPVRVYLTDSAFNTVSGTPSVSLNIGPQSATGGGAQPLVAGFRQFNITHTAAGNNQTITPVNGGFTTVATDNYDVLAALGNPTLALSDGTTGSTTHVRQVATATSIGSDTTAVRWCLSHNQASRPSSGTNLRDACTDGLGPDNGWYTSRPSSINIPSGDGSKTIYLWVADEANNVNMTADTDSITLDETHPAVPTVALSDPSTSDTNYTNETPVNMSITGDTDAVAWLAIEQAGGAGAPAAPLYNDGRWVGTRPTSLALGGTAQRRVFVYTKDVAGNVSTSAAQQVIHYDNVDPGIHTIVGAYGGSDATPDTTLATTLTPTITWSSAADTTTVTYSVLIQTLGNVDQCGGVQTTTATAFNFTGCNLTDGQTYKVSLTAEDAAGNTRTASNSGSFTFTVDNTPPDAFLIGGATGGSDSIADIWLGSGDKVTANWADTNGEASYKVSILDNSDVEFCSEVTKAANATSHDFSSCTLTNGTVYKIHVIAVDSVGNERPATNSPFAFTVSTTASKFLVEKVTGGNPVAGTAFDIRITAQTPGDSTDTDYDGNKTIDFAVSASSGSDRCGAGVLTPTHPGNDFTVNFTNGVATVSSAIMFKRAESGATFSATEDGTSVTGTSGVFTVDAGAQNCVRIETAAGGAGSLLGAQALSLNGSFDAFAVGYDAYGNFVGNPSVTWSGSSDLANLPVPTVGSSTKLVGVKAGSGNLTATGSSDSIAVTVATGSKIWTDSDSDSNANIALASDNVEFTHHWDTYADSDTAWMTNSGLSWYSEATSSTRGSRNDFPRLVRLVVSDSALDVIDGQNNDLFMRFNIAAGAALDSTLGSITSIAASNGQIYVGFDDSSNGALVILDLKADEIFTISGSSRQKSDQDISGRNVTTASPSADTTYPMIATSGDRVLSLASYDDSGVRYLAVGTENGVNVMRLTATTSIYKDDTTGAVEKLAFDNSEKLYYYEGGSGIHRADLSLPLGTDFTPSRSYNLSSAAELASLNINDFKVAIGQSDADGGENLIIVGSDAGLTSIHEHSTESSSTSRTLVATGTGTSFGNAVLLNGTTASIDFANSGNLTNTMTIEFLFNPKENLNSGSSEMALLSLGNPTTDGSIGINFNSAADGTIEFFVRHSGTTYSVFSSETSWSSQQWYHIAVTIDSSNGMSMWIDGNNRQTNSINLTTFSLDGVSNYQLGSDGTNYFDGQIDEFRAMDSIEYSAATFTVPSSEFTSNANTEYLYHFNGSSGTTAAFSDTGASTNATLVGNATFVDPLLDGSTNNITAVDSVESGSTSAHFVTSAGWYELSNIDDSTAASSSIIDSDSGSFNDLDIYFVDSATNSDILLGTPTSGFKTINR